MKLFLRSLLDFHPLILSDTLVPPLLPNHPLLDFHPLILWATLL